MSCEHLICAYCAGPVAEGRCPSCRAARAEVHHPTLGHRPHLLIAALLLLAALATLLATHLTG